MKEKEIYDYYQERSKTAGDRANQLAWMFVIMMAATLMAGKLYDGFLTAAMLSAVHMLLSTAQALWQTVTAWLLKQRVNRTGAEPDDYPSWIGGGAWVFYWLKMIAIAAAVIYFVKSIYW